MERTSNSKMKKRPEFDRMIRVDEDRYQYIKETLEAALHGKDTGDWDGKEPEFKELELAPPEEWTPFCYNASYCPATHCAGSQAATCTFCIFRERGRR